MPGKRIHIDDETWPALQALASDRMATFQELADEAFADLLAKHGRAADLATQLKRSARSAEEPAGKSVDRPPRRRRAAEA